MKYVFIIVVFLMSFSVQAQEKPEIRDDYIKVSFKDLSKTYWWLSLHDISEQKAVDEFARIHDCDVYRRYYRNDFQWERIRQGIAEELKRNRASFPNRYYVVIPLFLNRYDFESQAFEFKDNSKMDNVNFINILDKSDFEGYCELKDSVLEYPDVVNVSFKDAFNLPNLPLSQGRANDLVMNMNDNNNKNRAVFLKLNFRISGYDGLVASATYNTANLKGVVESYEIFEDPDLKILLLSNKVR
ncbi:MAG: hypothetical protein CMH30_02660 [Micavibrio sp.]|nr:hypothetical protein [Micavibrio sp.]|tara:strand:- start:2763 stop:3491 length:729 start_codon:yes stop_codon:yes gene_type:complete